MKTKVVTPWIDQQTFAALSRGLPEAMTRSEWVRTMVEVLASWSPESRARAELKDAVENPYRRAHVEIKTGPHKFSFRVRADHWAVMETLAQEQDCSRMEYLRRVIYMGTVFRGGWYRYFRGERQAREVAGWKAG